MFVFDTDKMCLHGITITYSAIHPGAPVHIEQVDICYTSEKGEEN
jgi:hypothetical protein